MSDGLVAPLNAPPAGAAVPGVQPGTSTGVVVARYVIVSGAGGGVFVYSGTPGPGNPPIAWMGGGGHDPFGNPLPATSGIAASGVFEAGNTRITPAGIFIYNGTPAAGNLAASLGTTAAGIDSFGNPYISGNGLYGPNGQVLAMSWFSGAGTEPIFYLTPQTTTITEPFSSPFLDTAAANLGLANEYLRFFISSGTPDIPGSLTRQCEIALNSSSADSTLPARAGIYGGNSGNLMFDISPAGITAADPNAANTLETWHAMTLLNGWTGTAQYRLGNENRVYIRTVGSIAAGTVTSGTAIWAVPAGYRAASQQNVELIISAVGAGAAAAVSPYLAVAAGAGNMTIQNTTAQNPTNLRFNGSYPLD